MHTLDGAIVGPPYPQVTVAFTGQALRAQVIRRAHCAGSSLDAGQWFPVSVETEKGRLEAAAAIAVCTTCPVRGLCLALSLRHGEIGQHGVWGAPVAGERGIAPPAAREDDPPGSACAAGPGHTQTRFTVPNRST